MILLVLLVSCPLITIILSFFSFCQVIHYHTMIVTLILGRISKFT